MRYIAAEDIARAKEMDPLTYLRNYEPQELVHVSGNTYCTREHDSLRISNGKWCWFSQGIGGRSALDYLIKVKGIPFTQAAEIILGREAEKPPVFYRQKERRSAELLMPELSETTDRVEKYLQSRGIHPLIIRYCVENKLLFESADFHSAVFIGYDKDGKARYLSCCLDCLLLLWYFLFKRGYRLRKDNAAGHSGNQHGLPERAGCHQGFRCVRCA